MKTHIPLNIIQKCLLMCSLALGGSATALATTIEYGIAKVSGTEWQYSYTVKNDSPLADFVDFVIYFPTVSVPTASNLFTNISVSGLSEPAGWSPTVAQWSAIDLGGYVDFLATTALPASQSESGFKVTFDYSGSGTPGSQLFEIYDSTFQLLDTGNTVLAQPNPCTDPTACPEPATLALLATGLVGLFARRRAPAATFQPLDSTLHNLPWEKD